LKPLEWRDGRLSILDQTLLPFEEANLECTTLEAVEDAIKRLAIRGAPILGIAAGYAMCLAASNSHAKNGRALRRDLRMAARSLAATRPTAVNIGWSVRRVLDETAGIDDPGDILSQVLESARCIEIEDRASCDSMGRFGAELVPDKARIVTHCNTGHLCTAGIGTAQGIIETAHRNGKRVHVWVDETRPVLQGARLTAWELQNLGIPMKLIPDGAAASLMAAGEVDLVITGADRIAANGDVANKIGTYALAVLAGHHKIPFYVAAPISTVDLATPRGSDIPIEERDPDEVTNPRGVPFAPAGTPVANPAFDITPAGLITAIITDRGVARGPLQFNLRKQLSGGRSA
jgi:methylthioribose-1-phosphate isomerase